MKTVFCPSKDKDVYFQETQIKAGTLKNPNQIVPGRIKCMDADEYCTSTECPLLKNRR